MKMINPVPSTVRLIPVRSRRVPRILQRKGVACYHVVSRINARAFLMNDEEKECFRDLMRRVAEFCGIRLLTYALLDNHFHILTEVPPDPGDLDDPELLRRASLLYGKERPGQPLSRERIELALHLGGETRQKMRDLLIGRMASLPMFVKILKQRYALQYNRKYDRVGTLWEDRFHSVLVESTPRCIRAVAAYIDLNPVRAGIVGDPKDYRFSGYGEAVGTKGGLGTYPLFGRLCEGQSQSVPSVASDYRKYLYISGSTHPENAAFTADECRQILAQGGQLSTAQLLRCRLRYMTKGVIIGSRRFIEEWKSSRQSDEEEDAPLPRADSLCTALDPELATLR